MEDAGPPREGRVDRFLAALARAQVARPGGFIAVALLIAAISFPVIVGALPGVDGLTLESSFTALLPESAQSVQDLEEVQRRSGGTAAMILAFRADDLVALRALLREVAPRIAAREDLSVDDVDWNVGDFTAFVREHRHLYADLADLRALRDALEDRIAYEEERHGPWNLGLDDGPSEAPPDPRPLLERMETRAADARRRAEERYPEGFFQHPDEPVLMMIVHTRIRGGNTERVNALEDALREIVDQAAPAGRVPGLEVLYGGTLIEVRNETASLVAAVRNATLLTIALVALAIFVFFLRVRPIPLLALVLLPPVLATFALAELTVDYLTASSAFLSSIVVGNGINPNVLWLARYFEARRQGEPIEAAATHGSVGTWRGTLTAATAAGAAYGSLVITDFRGFRDFGIIGGIGMILCWIAAYALLPALAAAFERLRPLRFRGDRTYRGVYGVLFVRLGMGRPRTVLAASILATVLSVGLVGRAVALGPFERDFRNLRSVRDPSSEASRVLDAGRATFRSDLMTGSGMLVLADDRAQAQRFAEDLEALREDFPRAYGVVRSVEQLLPADQELKLPVLAELRELMLEVRPRLDADAQARLDEELPPEILTPLTPADLPRSVARPFTERGGERGRIIAVEHHRERANWDGGYLVEWAGAVRQLRAEGEDEPPPIAGTATVFADLTQTVFEDGPRTVFVSFLATVVLLLVTFRRTGHERCRDAAGPPRRHPVDGRGDGGPGDAPQLPELRRLPHHLRQRRRLRRQHHAALRRGEGAGPGGVGGDPRSRGGHRRRGHPLQSHHDHRLHVAVHQREPRAEQLRAGHGDQRGDLSRRGAVDAPRRGRAAGAPA
jgi:hypothetical protein